MTITDAGDRLLRWIKEAGGHFHEGLKLHRDDLTGLSIYSTKDIPAESYLISCPFSCAITPSVASAAISSLLDVAQGDLGGWSEKMLIAAYLALHWAGSDVAASASSSGSRSSQLRHWEYVEALPPTESLLSPLQFTELERGLLGGTNLSGAVEDRLKDLRREFEVIQVVLKDDITWEKYVAASTFISSRAFPSKLLKVPTGDGKAQATATDGSHLTEEEESHPVLLPGLDLFNHARGQPITWLSSPIPSSSTLSSSQAPVPSVSFLNPTAVGQDQQVYNNYGPKSNEELLLSYGFVLDPNPDDTVILRLGAALPEAMREKLESRGLDHSQRFYLRTDGEIPKDLLVFMRAILGDEEDSTLGNGHVHGEGCNHDHYHNHEDDEAEDEDEHEAHEKEMRELDLEMDVLGNLGGMLEDRLKRLQSGGQVEGPVREEVRKMCHVYREGQIRILEQALDKLSERIERLEGLLDQGMGGCPCGC